MQEYRLGECTFEEILNHVEGVAKFVVRSLLARLAVEQEHDVVQLKS